MLCKRCNTNKVKYKGRGRPAVVCSDECRGAYRSAAKKEQRAKEKRSAKLKAERLAAELKAESEAAAQTQKAGMVAETTELLKSLDTLRKSTAVMRNKIARVSRGIDDELDIGKLEEHLTTTSDFYELVELDLTATRNRLR